MIRTTKAAILSQINQPLEIDELIIPDLKRGQVLVKIAYSGICHSQLNEIRGLKGEDKFMPHALGHEGSGIVIEVGPEVQKVKAGEHVVLTWIKGSGLDPHWHLLFIFTYAFASYVEEGLRKTIEWYIKNR